jgi:hypothetical protein
MPSAASPIAPTAISACFVRFRFGEERRIFSCIGGVLSLDSLGLATVVEPARLEP